MDKQFEYKGYVCKIYHFTYNNQFTHNEKITGYGAALYKDSKQLIVTNHGWNLIQSYSIESVIEECKEYIDKLL